MDGIGTKLLVVILGVLVAAIGYRGLTPHSTFAAVGHDPDWDAAVQRSHDHNAPAVVLFTAGWCPACQALHEGALADPSVWRAMGSHTFVTVDLTQPTAAAHAHAAAAGVSGIPTLIRYDRDGHEVARTHGMPADQMVAWLQAD